MPPLFNFLRGSQASAEQISAMLAPYGISQELRDNLARYMVEAEERAVFRFNPAYLAQQLGIPRRSGLELMGAALQAGIIDLNWEVMCPHCKYEAIAFPGLQQAHNDFFCVGCQYNFQGHLDDEIHITFTVNERLRALSDKADDPTWRHQLNATVEPVNSHELLTLQVFRDLFVNEPLPEGESFQIKWLALMFTDLGGSTALYARQGDPRAYSLVREHFNILFSTVAAAGGAVVKTIGDAVMAVFPSGDLAIRAALAAQRSIDQFNQERSLGDDDRLRLKVGIHAGPALAVTLNERLDYFGTVVNAAARLEALANHGETIISRQAFEDGERASDATATPSFEHITLRGLDTINFEVVRLTSTPASTPATVDQ